MDNYARPDRPPVTVLRRIDGTVVQELQRADASQLVAAGFRAPESFTVRARDGVTELRGLLWRPAHFDSTRRYPIVDYIYPGPQVGSVGNRQFAARPGGNAGALAKLGFFVVQVDAMGKPWPEQGLPRHVLWQHDGQRNSRSGGGDHAAGGAHPPDGPRPRRDFIGHSGGGFSSTDAILSYPEFFKVAVSSAGNHDNRSYDFTWGEKYQGLLRKLSDSTDSFDSQSNWRDRNLRGHLLLLPTGRSTTTSIRWRRSW